MRYGTGLALVVVAAILWSGMGLAVRLIEHSGTWSILFWRAFGMVPVLMGFIYWRSGGHPWRAIRAVGWTGVIGGFGLILASAGAIFALQNTSVATAMFLYSSGPLFAALLGWIILGERVRAGTWASIALAGVGITIMVGDGLNGGAFLGNMAAILASLGFAMFTIALRWGRLADMMPAVVLGAVMSVGVACVMMPITGEPVMMSLRDIAIAVAMGAFMLGGGMVLYTIGSRVVPAAEATLLTIIEVMLGPFWVWLVLGETAGSTTMLGGFFLMCAVVVNALTGLRRQPVAAQGA